MKIFTQFKNTKRNIINRGFTLIEFVVIMSIFAIIASIVVFNYQGYQNKTALNALAHDIGLVIRQAQVFGISSVSDLSQTATIRINTGVSFIYDSNSNTFSTLIIFRDSNQNNDFDPSVDSIIETYQIVGLARITKIESNPATPVTGPFSVMFQRPNPEPFSNQNINFPLVITLADGRNVEKKVTIDASGRIYVE